MIAKIKLIYLSLALCVIFLLAVFYLALSPGHAQATQYTEWPTVNKTIDGIEYTLHIADSDIKRQQGFMHVKSITGNNGILFEFDKVGKHCMWMKNTHVPLVVIYYDSEWVELNRINLSPHNLDLKCSEGASKFAVEIGSLN